MQPGNFAGSKTVVVQSKGAGTREEGSKKGDGIVTSCGSPYPSSNHPGPPQLLLF